MTSYINQNDFRKLYNKRETPYGYGEDTTTHLFTDASTADKLNIKTQTDSYSYALLTEAIYQQASSNFDHISYGPSIENLQLLPAGSYTLNVDSALIKFDKNYTPESANKYYAFYKGEGSIIWAEDVTAIRTVLTNIDTNTVYKDGATMTGPINMQNNSIVTTGTVDGLLLSNHSHTGGSYDAPQITSSGIAPSAIQTANISDSAITTDKIQDYNVTAVKLNSNSVTTDKIVNLNVTNAKLAGSITYDKFDANNILSNIFDKLYPVGAIYITSADVNICPIQQYVGSWSKIDSGRVLQSVDSSHAAGTTIDAGLPNITGSLTENYVTDNSNASGAFSRTTLTSKMKDGNDYNFYTTTLSIDASHSSSIYGASTTVQPPAYVVNIFRRNS